MCYVNVVYIYIYTHVTYVIYKHMCICTRNKFYPSNREKISKKKAALVRRYYVFRCEQIEPIRGPCPKNRRQRSLTAGLR